MKATVKLLTVKEMEKLPHKFQVAFVLFCAKQVIHLTNSKEAHECIRLVELWLEGKATSEECEKAADAAYTAVYTHSIHSSHIPESNVIKIVVNAAWMPTAINNTSRAIRITGEAVNAAIVVRANKQLLIKEQRAYYEELLNFNENFEKVCL